MTYAPGAATATPARVVAQVPLPLDVEVVDDVTCWVELGSDDPHRLALWLTRLDADVDVIEGDELAVAFDRLASRFRRAAGGRVDAVRHVHGLHRRPDPPGAGAGDEPASAGPAPLSRS